MIYEGKIFDLDVPNLNNRVYSTEVVQEAVERYNEKIKAGTALGHLGMPSGPDVLNVTLENVSHVVQEIRIEDGKAYAKIRVLDTPLGLAAKQMIEQGVRTDLRTAGSADIDEHGVISNFSISSVNIVNDGA